MHRVSKLMLDIDERSVRLTAQLVISNREAVLAYSCQRLQRGPNGETHNAVLLQTSNEGESWTQLAWRRSMVMWIRHIGYPIWPPESVSNLEWIADAATLQITFRDEWVPFESGGESLWRGQLQRKRWSVRRIRHMDYDHADSPVAIPACDLALPESFCPPNRQTLLNLPS